jgi:hypothetical protein
VSVGSKLELVYWRLVKGHSSSRALQTFKFPAPQLLKLTSVELHVFGAKKKEKEGSSLLQRNLLCFQAEICK